MKGKSLGGGGGRVRLWRWEGSSCLVPSPKTWDVLQRLPAQWIRLQSLLDSACYQLDKYTGGRDLPASFAGLIQSLPRIHLLMAPHIRLLHFGNCQYPLCLSLAPCGFPLLKDAGGRGTHTGSLSPLTQRSLRVRPVYAGVCWG
jgi:hypothetical protein